MNNELYKKIFEQLDKMGALRKNDVGFMRDLGEGNRMAEVNPPILSDCLFCINSSDERQLNITNNWCMYKPYLGEQSDELGEILFDML